MLALSRTSIVSSLLWPRLASYWPVRNIQFGRKEIVQSEKQVATGRAPKTGARRIFEALKHQILRRVYEAGSQLPSSRSLANELHVSRTTVTVIYEQLAAEGASWNCAMAGVHGVTALQLRQRLREIKAAALASDMLTERLVTLHAHPLNSGCRHGRKGQSGFARTTCEASEQTPGL
ncbi:MULTISPECIES: GntR family transcriptional regulator [unclassified Rhizobium]|uniref:GntR family transcriptional regulator n=1 Tax=Rhizobium TaxID=379 RepID=UPI0039F735ED